MIIAILVLMIVNLVISIISLVIASYVGLFLVDLKEKLRETMTDLIELSSQPPPPVIPVRKNWDERFEEDLDEMRRRASNNLIEPR